MIKNKLEELKQNTRLIIHEIENIETEIEKTITKENTEHGEESTSENSTFTDEKSINEKTKKVLLQNRRSLKIIDQQMRRKKQQF